MILTVTPNPTIDRVLFVRNFAMQDVVRAERETVAPSGKAIDVSAVLHAFGVDTLALGLNAGLSGDMLESLLDDLGVPYDFVPAEGYTRVAALITDMDAGRQSTVIAHTLFAGASHLEELLERAAAHMQACWGMVCAGSLPPGMPADAYARLLAMARQHGVTTLLDSSGDSLRNGVTARPDILKMNRSELAALAPDAASAWPDHVDHKSVRGHVAELARALASSKERWAEQAMIVTLGKQGAVALTPDGNWYVPALSVPVVSPAGAGDGMTSGVILARYRGQSWRDALALGTAMAASVVMNPGTCECYPHQVEELLPQVEIVDV